MLTNCLMFILKKLKNDDCFQEQIDITKLALIQKMWLKNGGTKSRQLKNRYRIKT